MFKSKKAKAVDSAPPPRALEEIKKEYDRVAGHVGLEQLKMKAAEYARDNHLQRLGNLHNELVAAQKPKDDVKAADESKS